MRTMLPRAVAALVTTVVALTSATAVAQPSGQGKPTGNGPESGPGNVNSAQLVDIRTGRHHTFDRVVFEFAGGVPSYTVQYGELHQPGSGKPVDLKGEQSLSVSLQHGTVAEQTTTHVTPSAPAVAEVKLLGVFEKVIDLGIGVDNRSRTGFRAFTLTDPARLVVDVARQTTGGDQSPKTVIADYEEVPVLRAVGQGTEQGYCVEVTQFGASDAATDRVCDPLDVTHPTTKVLTAQPVDGGNTYAAVLTTDRAEVEFDLVSENGQRIAESTEQFEVVDLNGRQGRAFVPHTPAASDGISLGAIKAYDEAGNLLATYPLSSDAGDGGADEGDSGDDTDQIPPGQTPQGGVDTGMADSTSQAESLF